MQISQFLKKTDLGISHYCLACRCLHTIPVEKRNENSFVWNWNGNIVAPTFFPEIKIVSKGRKIKNSEGKFTDEETCHYFLTNGKIKYFTDCTHALKGLTIYLPALPELYRK